MWKQLGVTNLKIITLLLAKRKYAERGLDKLDILDKPTKSIHMPTNKSTKVSGLMHMRS